MREKVATTIEGFRCYASSLAHGSNDYPIEYFDRLYRLEAHHFWFRARNRIILRTFRRYLDDQARPRVLEIGCGTGYVLQRLAMENRYDLTGLESHLSGLHYARRRVPDVELVQADARDLPYEAEFDAIGAFDVIEHIDEDDAVLASIGRALKPGGIVVVTVPQHKWLWSQTDEAAMHKRRYGRSELVSKFRVAGLRPIHCTSFVTTLLPVMCASRLKKRQPMARAQADPYEFELSRTANAVCTLGMWIDETLIGMGLSLPFGGSLLAVGCKNHC